MGLGDLPPVVRAAVLRCSRASSRAGEGTTPLPVRLLRDDLFFCCSPSRGFEPYENENNSPVEFDIQEESEQSVNATVFFVRTAFACEPYYSVLHRNKLT